MKVLVVMPAGPPEEYDAITSAGHEVAFGSPPGNRFLRLSDDELIALAADASCVVYNFCSRYVMESLPRLATVVSPYVGYDKIDVEAATELGILVCNNLTPESLTSTAEGAVRLILSLAKGISRGEARGLAGLGRTRGADARKHRRHRWFGAYWGERRPAARGVGRAVVGPHTLAAARALGGAARPARRLAGTSARVRLRDAARAADAGDGGHDRRGGAALHEADRLPRQHGARRTRR